MSEVGAMDAWAFSPDFFFNMLLLYCHSSIDWLIDWLYYKYIYI